jgi:hypothetical protein
VSADEFDNGTTTSIAKSKRGQSQNPSVTSIAVLEPLGEIIEQNVDGLLVT